MLGDMVVRPADRLGHIADDGAHVHLGQKPVVGGHKHKSLVVESLGFDLNLGLVAGLPAPSMDPEHHREIFRVLGRVDIQHLTGMAAGHIRDVFLHRLCRNAKARQRQKEQRSDSCHGGVSTRERGGAEAFESISPATARNHLASQRKVRFTRSPTGRVVFGTACFQNRCMLPPMISSVPSASGKDRVSRV